MARLSLLVQLLFCMLWTGALQASSRALIYVSVEPYRDIVQYLVKDAGEVLPIVSSSMSSHTFEPTPKITQSMQKANFWIGIGEPFEAKLLTVLTKNLRSTVCYLNLKKEIFEELVKYATPHSHCGHGHHSPSKHSIDPHIWMSPTLMQQQIECIAQAFEAKSDLFDIIQIRARAQELIEKCIKLDEKAQTALSEHKNKSILAAHPVYGYLLRPLKIGQYALEEDGKEPSPSYLTKIIQKIQKEQIHTIFTQIQYPSKGAQTVSEALSKKDSKIDIVQLDPYSRLYFQSMEKNIEAIATALQQQTPSL
ncbi:MAG: metal ABC transporter substrate-binding protein [Chlamydia sp.]